MQTNRLKRLLIIGLFFTLVTATALFAQSLAANDDYTVTGPLQAVKVNVLINDIVPCKNYTLTITAPPQPSEGMATVMNGYYIVFTPTVGVPSGLLPQTVTIGYEVACGGATATATLTVTVNPFNAPANVIPHDAPCADEMDRDIPFGIKRKFSTLDGFSGSVGAPTYGNGYCIDAYSSPLVADLNGDLKPEIIALGVNGNISGTAINNPTAIRIYNGQTGAHLLSHGLGFTVEQDHGDDGWHRPPSMLAVADVDRDGLTEIIIATPSSGDESTNGVVRCYKPVYNGATLAGLTQMWQAATTYHAPLAENSNVLREPHPYIVDINGDGIPELIIYNKVYNAKTGDLLMSWNGAASSPQSSTLASGTGLVDRRYANPTTQANANLIKAVAMTGRRNQSNVFSDAPIPCPAICDIDGDGIQEIITGNRIHKIQINSLSDHTQNTYTTIEGPPAVTLKENQNNTTTTTHYLSDGFTRVTDVDGDGQLDIIVVSVVGATGNGHYKIMVYVWDTSDLMNVKAALTYYSEGRHGGHGIPFIGDINGKTDGWDGTNYTRKLPEICIISGAVYINRYNNYGNRSGIKFHPLADEELRRGAGTGTDPNLWWDNNNTSNSNCRFNRPNNNSNLEGHAIGLTYDAQATDVEDRLKLSWALEHLDNSQSTGITLFDFDNNGTSDICYKDMATLRVISPPKGNNGLGRDYVTYNETEASAGTSIMFRTPPTNNHPDAVFGGTGFECPVIADVNLDGSADIIVTRAANSQDTDASHGYIMVFEYSGRKWAPAPPVWNQGLYNPLHIDEDLTVPAKPQDMLRVFLDYNNHPVTPYNGSWIQQPIVKEGHPYVPVVRLPDAVLTDMEVTVVSPTETTVTLTILNTGSATIGASDPISFYDGNLINSAYIGKLPVGVDIFPQETETRTYTLNSTTVPGYSGGYNFNNHLIWARIMDDNTGFPSTVYEDCDPNTNDIKGIDCPFLNVKIKTSPDNYICGYTGTIKLSVTGMDGTPYPYQDTPAFQWYRDNIAIPNATDSIFITPQEGSYRCLVQDGICFKRTAPVEITQSEECKSTVYMQVISCISNNEIDLLSNDAYDCDLNDVTITIVQQPAKAAEINPVDRNISYTLSNLDFVGMDSIKYQVACNSTGIVYHVTLYINILPCIDNIIVSDCYTTPPQIDFSIKELARSDYGNGNGVSLITSPVAGDIDGDGETEILVMNHTGFSNYFKTNAIHIYGFNKVTNALYLKYIINVPQHSEYPFSPIAIAKVNENSPYASVFYASNTDRTFYKYDFNGNIPNVFPSSTSWTQKWGTQYTDNAQYKFVAPVIADIMGNGRTQAVILNKVIDTWSGKIIADGGTGMIPSSGRSSTHSFGWFGHCGDGTFNNQGAMFESSPVVIDVDNDGIQELIGGDCVYGIHLVDFDKSAPGNTFILKQRASKVGHTEVGDGGTAVADVDNDGQLEVIVAGPDPTNRILANLHNASTGMVYVYNPRTGEVIHSNTVTGIPRQDGSNYLGPSRPFVGDFDNDGIAEIALTGVNTLRSYKYNKGTGKLDSFWTLTTSDGSGSTTLTVFDFAHDGRSRLVYRDETHLRIIDGSTTQPFDDTKINCVESPTVNEFPIIADINGDGAAEIIVVGADSRLPKWQYRGELRVYASAGDRWAPARKVWNQAAYNSVNVNEDLTIPRHPISPATVFPGADGLLGTNDDVRPLNGFLMQQSILNVKGQPLWLLPDITPVPELSNATLTGDSVTITIGMTNQGAATINSPVHFSLYQEPVSSGTFIKNDSAEININTGDTLVITFKVAVESLQPAIPFIVRLNDKEGGLLFPFHEECKDMNNEINLTNPSSPSRLATKSATLNGVPNDGTLANPVSVLYSDTIEYTITAFNAFNAVGTVKITDVLPPYLKFESSQPPVAALPFGSSPTRDSVVLTITGVSPFTIASATIKATPHAGVSASQPLFINSAWVTINDGLRFPTNSTYHQGAGVSLITFSSGYGGNIYNASQQALDYRTSPKSGVIVVPNEGYVFAGWSHRDYRSLRGETIKAQSGIMRYDTLTIYGDVGLRADFEPEIYPITYHLHEGVNAESNPLTYTIESGAITLDAPEKAGDVFVGWTGSNGEEPQPAVTIPAGSTGERVFYANYLYSGRDTNSEPAIREEGEKVWSAGNKLYIRTTKSGNILRIYSPEGVLRKQQTILQPGETTIKLQRGLYVITLNNSIGQKIRIE